MRNHCFGTNMSRGQETEELPLPHPNHLCEKAFRVPITSSNVDLEKVLLQEKLREADCSIWRQLPT